MTLFTAYFQARVNFILSWTACLHSVAVYPDAASFNNVIQGLASCVSFSKEALQKGKALVQFFDPSIGPQ